VRIIGGTVGGRTLKARKGRDTRPTADRVREAIFNMLVSRAMGLEALSRGAREAVFVESDPQACELIRENAAALGFGAAARVIEKKVLSYQPEGSFGWIFLDPPYASHELEKALRKAAPHLDEAGIAVAEHDWRNAPSAQAGLALDELRRYGQTAVSIFRRETP
jgi:16S rRNA (guanine966-N2)-methyltransferase